jgi:hypothetical protein
MQSWLAWPPISFLFQRHFKNLWFSRQCKRGKVKQNKTKPYIFHKVRENILEVQDSWFLWYFTNVPQQGRKQSLQLDFLIPHPALTTAPEAPETISTPHSKHTGPHPWSMLGSSYFHCTELLSTFPKPQLLHEIFQSPTSQKQFLLRYLPFAIFFNSE